MNIGFLAMSGVRVCDEELLRIGLTLPGFVERSKVIASLPSLGLLTLAGMTPTGPGGHDLRYAEAIDAHDDLSILHDRDLVAISFLTAQAPAAYAIADRLRARGTTVVMGGLHATALPDEAARHADAVIVGEGEPLWPRVLSDAAKQRLLPRYLNLGPTFDLANAPMPAFHLLDLNRYNRITVQTSRGCPWKCDFCASSITLTPRYKQKPIHKVLDEIDRVRELWPRPFIELADDNSFVNKPYWKRLLPELARRNIRWFTETDISVADDPVLLDLLADAGCAQVLIGIESPTPQALRNVELNADWKAQRAPDALDAVNRIQSRGIRVNGCFVVGLDGHTPDVFDAVLDFADRAALFDVQITLPTPFPNTPFHDRLARENRLTVDIDDATGKGWERCTLFDLNFAPSPMSAPELHAGFLDLMKRLYDEQFQRSRRDRFNAAAIAHRAAARRSA